MESKLLYATQDGVTLFQVIGRGTYKICPSFRKCCEDLLAAKDATGVTIDLSRCESMDSTFMGIMVMLGIKMRGKIPLLVVNAKPVHRTLLDGIGVSRVWRFVDEPVTDMNWHNLAQASAGAIKDMTNLAPIILEAHQALIDLDPANLPKFKDVVELLKAEQQP
ncbi:MAG TPA: STAS domain-containing protein [Lentisphaeria bacterium]|nr:STAS domain-containing protein [Lentisphaerota bacterium]OQC15682.1 MAG: hypothetical protein BWX73_01256 [Lentisphaerae bacterium ADurb.Bin082]HQC52360.1 STAS domain-containing protein [Lentisphaeria bacterium]